MSSIKITKKVFANKYFLFIIYSFFFSLNLKGQIVNFPIQNFSPKEYGKNYSSQNFCVIQDKFGYVYFGNANGILQYDGKSWEFIPVKVGAYVSTLTMDSTGTLFVGSQNEFGYLKSNTNGNLVYYSLSAKLKGDDAKFGTIIKSNATDEAIFFQSQEKIFVYRKDSSLKVITPTTSFHTSFVVNNQFYVRERKIGLLKFYNNQLHNTNGTSAFNDMGIFAMLPYDTNGDILIATMEMGLFKYSPTTHNQIEIITPLKTSNDELILRSGLYGGIKLKNGDFVFNTLNDGLLILNKTLNITSVVNKEMGLRVDDVKQLFEDEQHNLWLALNNGISKVAYNLHLSYYADESGLQGSVHAIAKHDSIFYIATSNGLFHKQNLTNKYTKLTTINAQIWALFENKNMFIAAGEEGIYEIDNLQTKKVSSIKCRSINFDSINHVWLIGNDNGITLLNEKWDLLKSIKDINTEIISILIKPNQKNNSVDVWAGTLQQGIFHILINKNLNSNLEYIGLPKGLTNEYIVPLKFDDKIIFGSSNGIYSITKSGNYELLPFFNGSAFNQKVSSLYQNQQNNWLSINNHVVLYNTETSKILEIPFRAIDKGQIQCFYQENSTCWIGTDDGLIRYDILNKRNFSAPFQVQIRKVNCGKDSIIYNGNITSGEKIIPQLNYNLNSIYFEYVGMFFEDGQKNMYSYKLEGQDTAWSNWSFESKAVFTNLREGEYTFFIKSKNIYNTKSNTASYSFTIKTPWHRTWAMYIVYLILLTLIIYLFIKNRTKKLILEKEKLEKIISERTSEIILQKDEISQQKYLIEEKHKEITDSINYAERIQRSFLATKNLLDENLKDYFVFFQPKDVVSGDFYWGSKLADGNFTLVTADSTGHGVPGAIMSILNISSLEKAIEKNLLAPAEILNDTRTTIIERLKKDGSIDGGKDGMDCSLISFNFSNREESGQNLILNYSAANNPIWIIRKSTPITDDNLKKIIELKPDKMPVGKSDHNQKSFTQHQFQLQKGDVIYTLTDGFPDQFGGVKGKKFMNKQLKEFLISIAHLSMETQKNKLNQTFNNWKGDLEQVDDVCIIGIRI